MESREPRNIDLYAKGIRVMRNCRNLHIDAKGDGQAHPREALSTDAMLQGRIDSQ
jgi:hypothetical protein